MRRLVLTILCVLVIGGAAVADWDPGMPAKWVQFPDLTPEGVDVKTGPVPGGPVKVLADDFLCECPGPLTDIHIWGSWLGDHIPFGEWPEGVAFRLSIHADIPAEQSPTQYSMPGELLWERFFGPGSPEVVARPFAEVPGGEWWYDPNTGEAFPQADFMVWQYNFFIKVRDAFFQKGTLPDFQPGPMVYWLDVEAFPEDPQAQFGWKTSPEHWNDGAVWIDDPAAGMLWNELIYPQQHPFFPQRMDMAFVVNGLMAGDVDGDCFVGGSDLSTILTNWGMIGATRNQGDLDGDGFVGGGDYSEVLTYWGITCCLPAEPAVPEPATLALFLTASLVLLSRRTA